MRNCFMLASANLLVLCSLIFTCGCQNESAATKDTKSAPLAYVAPPKARALGVEEHLALDKLATKHLGSFDSKQINWEEDVSQETSNSEPPPNFDAIINFESNDPGKISEDAKQADEFLQEAWQQ